jgi:carbon-monoxide dehydrogenase large subunit
MHRHAGSPIETRGIVADWDNRLEHLTLYASTQVAHHARDHLAAALGLRLDQVRVIAPDVGGGFGVKDHLYPDEVLVALASIRLKRPVKWIEDRVEHLLGSVHARDHEAEGTLAVDEEGNFLAYRIDIVTNLGGHPSNVGAGPAAVGASMSEGPYRFPRAGSRCRGIVSNRTPVGAYRGFGMPEGTFVRERVIDEICRTAGFDHEEIRRRNLVTRDEMPYATRNHGRMDSGDYVRAFDRVNELLPEPEREGADGKLRVRTIIPYAEMTAVGPTSWMQRVDFRAGGYETSIVEMAADGYVTVRTGVCSQGQGHETTLAQIVADNLGIGMDDVKVIQGDTEEAPYSPMGTIASRSLTLAGAAANVASVRVRDKLVAIAAHQLEAHPDDIEIMSGKLQVRGTPSAFRTMKQVAESAWLGWDLPADVQPGALLEREVHDPQEQTISYATHGFQIAIDPELGKIEIEKVVVVHDCGTVVNPMIVEGQTHGGLAQGIGEVLLEAFEYDELAQPLTTTFKDYLIPVTETIPDVEYEHYETPAPHIPGGYKGTGEGGTVTAPAAIASGLARLFPELSPHLRSTNMAPHKVWELLEKHRVSG